MTGSGATTAPEQLTRGPAFAGELGALARLAGPIIISQLGQVGMTTADTIMVGPLGAVSLAAAGAGTAIHGFFLWSTSGVIIGMGPLVSQAYGAGDVARCRRIGVQGVWLALALTIPVMLVSIWGGPIAAFLGQQPDVAALVGRYTWTLAWGVPPALAFVVFRQYLEGMGFARPAMTITFIGLALNILCNWLLIYGVDGVIPALGLVGAGWATTIVRWVMLGAVAIYFLLHRELVPRGVPYRPDRELLSSAVRIGTPVGGQLALEVGFFCFAALMMGWLGAVALAAHQITINLASTTFMVALGVSIAGSVRVGHHVGAQRARELHHAVVATYLLAVGFMGLCALMFVALPHELVGLYTHDPKIVPLAVKLLLIAAAFQIFDGSQVAGISVLRGAGDTRTPMIICAVGYWGIGLPVGYFLAFRTPLEPLGLWAGFTVGLASVAILFVLRVRKVVWKTMPGQVETIAAQAH